MPKNAQADGRTYGRTDRRTKGWKDPILKDYSGYYRGSNICNCSRLAFKSQRYSTMLV